MATKYIVIIPAAVISLCFFTSLYFDIHFTRNLLSYPPLMRYLQGERKNETVIFSANLTGDVTEMKSEPKRIPKFWNDFSPSFDPECYFSSPAFHAIKYTEYFDFLKTDDGKKYKTILAWNNAFNRNYGFGFGILPFKDACCKETRCCMTATRDHLPIAEFDAILFHHLNLDPKSLPNVRTARQRWIFYEREPPPHSSKRSKIYDGLFNWTMTYRMDSDVLARSYGYIYPKEDLNRTLGEGNLTTAATSISKKEKLVAWVVSHCATNSRRENNVKKLQNYIKVDIYGNCGPLKCAHGEECFEMIGQLYKFYLSFENSLCKDYTTEKFIRILKYNIVPVVFGGGDYEYIAPPHSYIDSQKFESEKAMADYLLYLDKNDTAYLEYFRWKTDFLVLPGAGGINFCNLCQKLHENNLENKSYQNLMEWFIGKAKCKSNA